MERMVLEAEARGDASKGRLKQLRREDRVPAVIYGKGKPTQSLMIEGKPLRHILSTGGGNVLVDLSIKQKGKKSARETVMFRDVQRHIIQKDSLLHVDFIRISMKDKIEVGVQINYTGEPVGVREGGIIQILAREVSVKCLPGDIPDSVEVDLSDLVIGDSITAGTLDLPEGVDLLMPPEEPLAQILAPVIEEEPEAEEEAEDIAAEETEQEEAAKEPEDTADAPGEES